MTRKDYIKFAEMFKSLKPQLDQCEGPRHWHVRYDEWKKYMTETANIFKQDNPNFNHGRFYEACGREG